MKGIVMTGTDPKFIQEHPFVALAVAAVSGAISAALLHRAARKATDKFVDKAFNGAATFNKN